VLKHFNTFGNIDRWLYPGELARLDNDAREAAGIPTEDQEADLVPGLLVGGADLGILAPPAPQAHMNEAQPVAQAVRDHQGQAQVHAQSQAQSQAQAHAQLHAQAETVTNLAGFPVDSTMPSTPCAILRTGSGSTGQANVPAVPAFQLSQMQAQAHILLAQAQAQVQAEQQQQLPQQQQQAAQAAQTQARGRAPAGATTSTRSSARGNRAAT